MTKNELFGKYIFTTNDHYARIQHCYNINNI